MADKKPSLGVAENPQALVALGSGSGGGELVIAVLHHWGYDISTGWGLLIAGGVASATFYLWDKGLGGVWDRILHGNKNA